MRLTVGLSFPLDMGPFFSGESRARAGLAQRLADFDSFQGLDG